MKFLSIFAFCSAISGLAHSAILPEGRVANDVVLPGTSAFQAQILNRGATLCGAVLLSHKVALTAAHCLQGRDLSGLTIESRGTKYSVDAAMVHPLFDGDTLFADLAALTLTVTSGAGDAKLELQLAEPDEIFTDIVNFVGYGTSGILDRKPIGSQRIANLPYQSRTECQASYGENPPFLQPGMVCAGGVDGRSGLCGGDAGSGLTQLDGETGKTVLIGIGAFGFDCGANGFPSVFTAVADYSEWIKERLQ